jgi:hypothetical protein
MFVGSIGIAVLTALQYQPREQPIGECRIDGTDNSITP